jgi:hypothetical protein
LAPSLTPFANHSSAGADVVGNLLSTPVGLLGGGYDDLGAHALGLRSGMSTYQALQLIGLVIS